MLSGAAAATLATGVAGAGGTLGACLQCLQTGKSGNSDVATGNWKRTGKRNRQKTLLDTSKHFVQVLSRSAAWCIKDITKALGSTPERR